MKKSLFFGTAAFLLALAATSCKDDVLADYGSEPLDHDQTFFANISVSSAFDMTRDGNEPSGVDNENPYLEPDFVTGTEQENKVKTIYLVFYDENKNRVATTQVMADRANQSDGRNESENKLYSGVVQIDVKHGSYKPAYVMCFINPITATNFEINPNFESLDELQRTTRSQIIDGSNNFAMSKSVYYGYDPNESKTLDDYKLLLATPIEKGQLFTTVEEAQKALAEDKNIANDPESSVIDIYVERYAVKVDFSFTDPSKEYLFPYQTEENKVNFADDAQGNYRLKFVPEYWAVNAYESETYICKSFFPVDENGNVNFSAPMSFDTMDKALSGGDETAQSWFWNSVEHHRSYWAQSPAYYAMNYPRVADDILDKEAGAAEHAGGYALGYYSYDEMKKNATGKLADKARDLNNSAQSKMAIYARENTVQGAALRKAYENPLASPKAAIPSVVLVGHYELSTDGGDTFNKIKDDDFIYVMGNATNGYTLFKNYDEMLTYFVKTTLPFATEVVGGVSTDSFFDYDNENYGWKQDSYLTNYQDYKKYFKIDHPSKEVRVNHDGSELVLDSRFVTIQLNEEAFSSTSSEWVTFREEHPLYVEIDGKWTALDPTKVDINEINKQMLYAAGTVQGYNGGKAFFSIPIKHLGFYRENNENKNKNANDKSFDWTKVHSGDFGLVRNHVYTIEVSDIQGLGNGIPDPSEPIIPPTDPEEYFIGARIIVLNWAVVPTQTEIL